MSCNIEGTVGVLTIIDLPIACSNKCSNKCNNKCSNEYIKKSLNENFTQISFFIECFYLLFNTVVSFLSVESNK